MTAISSSDTLDPFSRGKVDLWHAASVELSIGPEADDPFVQAAIHAILEWLRGEAGTPRELLAAFGRPHGLLGPQLCFAGSLLIDPSETPAEPPRLWWWVVKTAYYPALARAHSATQCSSRRSAVTASVIAVGVRRRGHRAAP